MSNASVPLHLIETRNLSVKLTPLEMLDKGKELATACTRKQDAEDAKKAAASQHKATCDRCEADVSLLTSIVGSGSVHRDVRCAWIMNDPTQGSKTLYRLDTEEPVETRDMTGKDLQTVMESVDNEAAASRDVGGPVVDMQPLGLPAPGPLELGDGEEPEAPPAEDQKPRKK